MMGMISVQECFEESSGVVGDLLDILRALLLPEFHRRASMNVYMVSLGTLTRADRDAVVARFASTRPTCRGMTENVRVLFVGAAALRDACLGVSENESLAKEARVPGLRPYETLRHFFMCTCWLSKSSHVR